MGTEERPRLSIFRSSKHLYAQLIDDIDQKTLLSTSTHSKPFQGKKILGKGVEVAAALGEHFAKEAKSKGFNTVVFDRGGYLYHGRIKAFADSCRAHGLSF